MRAERKKFAVEFRAKGEEEASRIRATTDTEVATIEAKMTQEVAEITGEAEAQVPPRFMQKPTVKIQICIDLFVHWILWKR